MALSRRARLAIASLASLTASLVALVGFAHTERGRPLLALVGRSKVASAACPLGYGASPEARRKALEPVRGEAPSAARPALGFSLDRSTRADIAAWAASSGVRCDERRGATSCRDVPSAALPEGFDGAPASSVFFAFGERGTLVSVATVRHLPDAATAAAVEQAVAGAIGRAAGGSAIVTGEPTAEFLERGPLFQARAEYRFRDYHAVASATNMGAGGYVVTEQLESIPD